MSLAIWNNSDSFTRPNDATQYAIGDLVANSTTAGSVVPLTIPVGGQTGLINLRLTRLRLTKTGTSATSANFNVLLFTASPTPQTVGDNAAFSGSPGFAGYIGSVSVGTMQAFTDGCAGIGALSSGAEAFIHASNATGQSIQNIYALLTAGATYTPTAQEVFKLTLEEVAGW